MRLPVTIPRMRSHPPVSVHSHQCGHLLFTQNKIKYREVLDQALFSHSLREHHKTLLQMPAKDDLLDGLAVSFGDLGEAWKLGELIFSLAQRPPGFRDDFDRLLHLSLVSRDVEGKLR